jgi:peroxiredoxin
MTSKPKRTIRWRRFALLPAVVSICACGPTEQEAEGPETEPQATALRPIEPSHPTSDSPATNEFGHFRSEDLYRMVGQKPWPWSFDRWANSPPLSWSRMRGRVVVVSFWTDEGEETNSCLRTLQALGELDKEFADQPVTIIGAYFTGEPNDLMRWEHASNAAVKNGVTIPLAFDRDQRTLRQWWLRRFARLAPETASFIIGTDGRIVHVHPGPGFFPTEDPWLAMSDRDYRAVRNAIAGSLPNQTAATD